ncbi:MAG: hypothetical protein QXE05_09520 [Nitrososphaeria archaeon]
MGAGKANVHRIKRERMQGTLESIDEYHRSRGWKEPELEEKQQGQIRSYVKPLPDGSRLHRRVFRGRKYYTIVEHKDGVDPERNPLGHLQDIVIPPKHYTYRIRRID